MSDVAKVIPLHDDDFPARRRPAPRHWPSQPTARPVTSLTERLAQVPPRQQRSLGGLIRDTIADGIRSSADFARRRLSGDYQVDEFGLDERLLKSVLPPALRPLSDLWLRGRSQASTTSPNPGVR
ncbi:hypothetical protein [Nocardia nova]|uniref:hypothetical protein n=1 Tax=Nocardia nova TaxID=37330 RepID=UPI0025AF4F41|nr:hypothetical protein [Nocardia nova]